MRLVVEEHPITDLGEERSTRPDLDLAQHMHEVHHLAWADIRAATEERLELLHADDHDDLRRGCG